MKVSKRVMTIEPSLTRQMFNLAQTYDDVIDLTLGDPDLPPPKEIREAAYEAIEKNKLRYSANAGLRRPGGGRQKDRESMGARL